MRELLFEEFESQVHALLSRLYDYAYAEKHPLLAIFFPEPVGHTCRADRFRQLVSQEINALGAGEQTTTPLRERRAWRILQDRYVEKLDPEAIMARYAISERQFYREQRKAVEGLVALLWEKFLWLQHQAQPEQPGEAAGAEEASEGLRSEAELLMSRSSSAPVADLLEGVRQALEPLGRERGVEIALDLAPGLPPIFTNRILARQVLIQTLRQCITEGQAQGLVVQAVIADEQVVFRIVVTVATEPGPALERLTLGSAQELLGVANGAWLGCDVGDRQYSMAFSFPISRPRTLLSIEDNPGAVRLLQRYLTPHGYRVLAIPDGAEALAQVAEVRPDVIMLDIMLPSQDGWEVLHRLCANPATASIPVLVCSVLDERELAASMGADAYLKKPYSRDQLLEKLSLLQAGAPYS